MKLGQGLVVIKVDGDASLLLNLVRDGEGVLEVKGAILRALTEEGTKDAVLVGGSPQVGVQESGEDQRVGLYGGDGTRGGRGEGRSKCE